MTFCYLRLGAYVTNDKAMWPTRKAPICQKCNILGITKTHKYRTLDSIKNKDIDTSRTKLHIHTLWREKKQRM